MDINKFKHHILSKGITKQNRFLVTFTIPQKLKEKLSGKIPDLEENMSLMCINTEFPGYNIDTDEIVVNGHHFKSAYLKNYTELDFTFILNKGMDEKVIFDYWGQLVVDHATKEIEYPDEYKVDLSIENDGGIYKLNILKAFPTIATPVTMDKTSQNAQAIMTVKFIYKEVNNESEEDSRNPIQNLSLTSRLTKLQQISAFNPKKLISDVLPNLDTALTKARDKIFEVADQTLLVTTEVGNMYKTIKSNVNRYKSFGDEVLTKGYLSKTVKDVAINKYLTTGNKVILTDLLDRLGSV